MISGKKGKLYLRFIVAAAIIAAAIYSYAAIAANPAATPAIVNTSISVARASEVIK